MIRTVWLALICLISLAVIASVKLISAPTGKSASKILDPFDEVDVTPLAVKTDKLPASDIANNTLPDKVLVRTLKIAPQLSKQAAEEKKAALKQTSQLDGPTSENDPTRTLALAVAWPSML
jgi:hypothetical protein